MTAEEFDKMCPNGMVRAKCTIFPSPLSDSHPVQAGTVGWIQDAVDGYLWVDFVDDNVEPCYVNEVEAA